MAELALACRRVRAESTLRSEPQTAEGMDRRHWLLLLAALACIAGLLLWIGEIDLGMEETISPTPVPTTKAQP